jgi:hypothetical protein
LRLVVIWNVDALFFFNFVCFFVLFFGVGGKIKYKVAKNRWKMPNLFFSP